MGCFQSTTRHYLKNSDNISNISSSDTYNIEPQQGEVHVGEPFNVFDGGDVS